VKVRGIYLGALNLASVALFIAGCARGGDSPSKPISSALGPNKIDYCSTSYNVAYVGSTSHFAIYYDSDTLERQIGMAAGRDLLVRSEEVYQFLKSWFGTDIDPHSFFPKPTQENPGNVLNVILSPPGGVTHCGGTIKIGADFTLAEGSDLQADYFAGELIQFFQAGIPSMAQGDVGPVWGIGLNGAFQGATFPKIVKNHSWPVGYYWLNNETFAQSGVSSAGDPNGYRYDYVNHNPVALTGANYEHFNIWAQGCATLYFFWLHSVRGYSWQRIVAGIRSSENLAQLYRQLSGDSGDAFKPFLNYVNQYLRYPVSPAIPYNPFQ
jgi:hypothetical protein